jgi:hypothetical protein
VYPAALAAMSYVYYKVKTQYRQEIGLKVREKILRER